MPKNLRGLRRKLEKLSEEEQAKNKELVEKCCVKKVPLPGRNRWRLKECAHSDFPELEISPLWNCVKCIWESMDTDAEYDPALEEYDSDYFNEK